MGQSNGPKTLSSLQLIVRLSPNRCVGVGREQSIVFWPIEEKRNLTIGREPSNDGKVFSNQMVEIIQSS